MGPRGIVLGGLPRRGAWGLLDPRGGLLWARGFPLFFGPQRGTEKGFQTQRGARGNNFPLGSFPRGFEFWAGGPNLEGPPGGPGGLWRAPGGLLGPTRPNLEKEPTGGPRGPPQGGLGALGFGPVVTPGGPGGGPRERGPGNPPGGGARSPPGGQQGDPRGHTGGQTKGARKTQGGFDSWGPGPNPPGAKGGPGRGVFGPRDLPGEAGGGPPGVHRGAPGEETPGGPGYWGPG